MRIGVFGDTHDRLPCIREAIARFTQADVAVICHTGDIISPFAARLLAPPNVPDGIGVHCVYGNNDGERAGLAQVLPGIVKGPLRLTLGGRVVVLHHDLAALDEPDLTGAEVVITGHTHEVVNERRAGRLILNPGECCGWLTGRCTAAILDLDALSAQIIEWTP